MILFVMFLGVLAVFGICDYLAFKNKVETMSQYLTNLAFRSKSAAWVILGVLLATCAVLIWHFRLFEAIFKS